ncbi:polysialyltransferase family glycosyltransferase [Sulfurimonas sp.]|uniref:polysialyltransferase family glycosyltransferase n=1 Tax=Sulfurimonas sp. TaxID=2022749 RepID=UPI0026331EC9|nr:polysialyltransferase family glycosyltransferase [Sulfurimonas sp.]MDD5156440.1 polysialyltransferase family glycosyltransferase [Sulfurimonas sp.]
MTTTYNLFIVRSPLQLMNAIEAKEHFSTKHNILLIMHDSTINPISTNSTQMQLVSKLSMFDEEIDFYYPNKSKFSKLSSQAKLIKKLQQKNYEHIFTGDYGTINQLIIANLKTISTYLLDDGTMTMTTHANKLHPNHKSSWEQKIKLLRYKIFGLNTNQNNPVNLFTNYHIIPHGHEKIITNNYSYFKKTYTEKAFKDERIYLLGQSFTSGKTMTDIKYVNYIKKIIDYYKKEIIYIPHRAEIISDRLKALTSDQFTIQKNEGPIEIVFLSRNIYPMHVVSFYSSALFNLEKIFETTTIDAIKIDSKDLLRYHDGIHLCYEGMKNTRINVIELDVTSIYEDNN